MPHADEALKSLVDRFREAPGSRAFTELAAALLARGHAAEALRVAEHGLQLVPENVDGRVERAAALLALGRPRVAYVELRRALAIDPHHRRGMRLLGKAFVDAGSPTRAAALLARRSFTADLPRTDPRADPRADPRTDPRAEAPTAPSRGGLTGDLELERQERRPKPSQSDRGNGRSPAPPRPPPRDGEWDSIPEIPTPSLGGALPQLFSELTKDLGLGSDGPEAPLRRVEVTQIIRRKAMPRPPRSASELAAIEGPIVDTTQPGDVVEVQNYDPGLATATREPVPLFGAPAGGLASFTLDDEPLFQEHMPFAVRPVNADPEWDRITTEPPREPNTVPDRGGLETDTRDTLVDRIEESQQPFQPLSVTAHEVAALNAPEDSPHPPGILRFTAGHAPPVIEKRPKPAPEPHPEAEAARFDGAIPVVERSRAKLQAKLEVVTPPPIRRHQVFAGIAAVVMALYFLGWAWAFRGAVEVWLSGSPSAASAVEGSAVEGSAARAE